ncbi:MAG: class IV adenylate cyclase [Chloroflexota bacterium]|nr:MAG: class IV adenylate cyclase [Chloroflexota bacterium]
MSGENLEIEVKFLVDDLSATRDRLLALGARIHKPRVYERNIRFDSPWDGLLSQGKLLRLRQDTAARLTYKGEPQTAVESEAMVREELEVQVGDFQSTQALLERVGFEPKQVYEKYRETFTFGGVEVVLDEMPFGNFVELEGENASIRAAAAALELDWDLRILDNYLALMAGLKERFGLDFDDLTFENFATVEVGAIDLLKESH